MGFFYTRNIFFMYEKRTIYYSVFFMNLPQDNDWARLQLLSDARPVAVTRNTSVTSTATNIIVGFNANARYIRVFSDWLDVYLYFKDATDYTWTVSNTVFHRFVPANTIMDFRIPSGATDLTGITDSGTVTKFIVEQYA